MLRTSLAFAVGLYLGAGLFGGLLMQRAIPAINPLGIAYISATWPRVVICARTSSACDQISPEWLKPWLFTFSEQGH